jgi:hypothetical protein
MVYDGGVDEGMGGRGRKNSATTQRQRDEMR